MANEWFFTVFGASRGADTSLVYGRAAWTAVDRARAIATRVVEQSEDHGPDASRLTPLLACVLEQIPWIAQWHPESDSVYGGAPVTYFEGWLDSQLSELAVTRDALRAWRPPAPTRGRKAKASTT